MNCRRNQLIPIEQQVNNLLIPGCVHYRFEGAHWHKKKAITTKPQKKKRGKAIKNPCNKLTHKFFLHINHILACLRDKTGVCAV